MDPVEETIKTYDQFAEDYLKRSISQDNVRMRPVLDKFASMITSGKSVLDIGSGTGLEAKYLSENGLEVTGIDLSVKMIELAKKVAPKVIFLKMDMRSISLEDQIFDGVWASSCLVHIPKNDTEKVLSDISRILKLGGIFYFDLKQGEGEEFVVNQGQGDLPGARRFFAFYSLEEISELLQKSGFEILETSSNTNRGNVWLNTYCKKIVN